MNRYHALLWLGIAIPLSVVFVRVGMLAAAARHQQAQVDQLSASGYEVITQPTMPAWFSDLFQIRWENVYKVSAGSEHPVTNSHLSILSEFSYLQELNLGLADSSRSRLTDAGVVSLTRLKNLQSLSLAGHDLSDEGIGHLLELPRLQYLDISGSLVSAALSEEFRAKGCEIEGSTNLMGKAPDPIPIPQGNGVIQFTPP